MESKSQYNFVWRGAAYLVMLGFTFLTIGPLIWLSYSSLKPHPDIVRNLFSLPAPHYQLTTQALEDADLPEETLARLESLNKKDFFTEEDFLAALEKQLDKDQLVQYQTMLVKHARTGRFFFDNYARAWKLGNLGIYSLNSVFYSVVATIISTVLSLAAGYGITKFGYRISTPIYVFFMMGLLLTVHSILVPLFVMETKLGIDDTRLGVLLPYIAFRLPFLVFLAASFIKGLPGEIEEAAIIDGASYLGVFWHVIMPMARPVIATMLIFCFLANWNEFVFVFVLTSKEALRTLPVGINAFAGGMTRDYGIQLAALVIGTLPMIVFYIFFHKRLEQGFASGALKE